MDWRVARTMVRGKAALARHKKMADIVLVVGGTKQHRARPVVLVIDVMSESLVKFLYYVPGIK